MTNFDPLNKAPDVRVCGVDELDAEIACQPRSIISIWDPKSEDMQRHLENIKTRLPTTKVCVARFDDIAIEIPGRHLMKSEYMEEILRFSRTSASPILIHCRAGISRSTAVAYAILCQARGPGHELECMIELTRIRPQAAPNEYIVGLADKALRREGAMLRAYPAAAMQLFEASLCGASAGAQGLPGVQRKPEALASRNDPPLSRERRE